MSKTYMIVIWKPHLMNGYVDKNGRIWKSFSWTINETNGERYIITFNNNLALNKRWRTDYIKSDKHYVVLIKYSATRAEAQAGINLQINKENIKEIIFNKENRIIGKPAECN